MVAATTNGQRYVQQTCLPAGKLNRLCRCRNISFAVAVSVFIRVYPWQKNTLAANGLPDDTLCGTRYFQNTWKTDF
jgi:hypothetical protein